MPNYYQHNGTSYVHVSDYAALEARLAQAEALLREARRYVDDVDSSWRADAVVVRIDAFLSPDSAKDVIESKPT